MIETALYSFWSKPYREKNAFKTFAEFNTERDFVLSWSTSVKLSKQNFKKVVLVTDSWAWENIFKDLKLPFDEVKLSLDGIKHNTDIWSVSKAYSVLEMDEPFLHIDSDAYIWKPLSTEFLTKDVLVQDGEGKIDRDQYTLYLGLEWDYQKYLKGTNKYLDNSNLKDRDVYAWNCGIVGGTNVEFLHKWASEMISTSNLYDSIRTQNQYRNSYLVVWVEQTLLLLMAEMEGVEVTPILKERNEPQTFYTHLMGSSKRDVVMIDGLNKKHKLFFGELNYKDKNKSKKRFDISKIIRIFTSNKKL